jgi:solute carrier family 50 protein (sugar transporter)
MYAIPQSLTQPFVVNAAGMALNIAWLVVFMIYSDTRLKLALKILAVIAVCGATEGIYLIMMANGSAQDTAASIVGDIADVFNIGMYGSPLAAVGTVFATRSVETLPILMVSMTLVASALWGLYGKWIGDWHVGVPNDIGVLLAIVQIIVWLKFRNATPIDAARDKLVDGGNKVADETQA